MRRIVWFGMAVLVVGLIGAAFVMPSGALEHEKTLTFVLKPLNETGIDIDHDGGPTPGDGWVTNFALRRSGEVVGKVVQACQFAQVRRDGMGGAMQCVLSGRLPGGQVTAQTRMVLVEGKTTGHTAAITGGTGKYANVRGYVVGKAIEGSMNQKVTFHLLP